jgi:rSAM/selenodomain-associated transferase 1
VSRPGVAARSISAVGAADCALGVFLRAPERGRVKTRLAALLGADAALALYRAFLEDTARLCAACEPGFDTALWIDAAPGPAAGLEAFGPSLDRRHQPEGTLGARLAHALGVELQSCPTALLIGSDSPSLPAGYLALARRALDEAPLVLGPAVDGGYYLIGARRELTAQLPGLLAEVRWSTPHALADTCLAARSQGLDLRLLPPWFDVDDRVGLDLLRLQLGRRPGAAPASARCLAALGQAGLLTWPVGY